MELFAPCSTGRSDILALCFSTAVLIFQHTEGILITVELLLLHSVTRRYKVPNPPAPPYSIRKEEPRPKYSLYVYVPGPSRQLPRGPYGGLPKSVTAAQYNRNAPIGLVWPQPISNDAICDTPSLPPHALTVIFQRFSLISRFIIP